MSSFSHGSKADVTASHRDGDGHLSSLTALWPARRSRGPRCPFCSGPSSAPAEPGWASVLLRLRLQSTGKMRAVEWNVRHPSSSHRSEFLLQEGLHTAPCCPGGRAPPPSCPPLGRDYPQGRQSTGRYLLHTGWSSAGRAAWQTPFSHRSPVERTEAVAYLLSISVQRSSSSTSSLSQSPWSRLHCPSHPHWTRMGSHWPDCRTAPPPLRCFCISLYLEGPP